MKLYNYYSRFLTKKIPDAQIQSYNCATKKKKKAVHSVYHGYLPGHTRWDMNHVKTLTTTSITGPRHLALLLSHAAVTTPHTIRVSIPLTNFPLSSHVKQHIIWAARTNSVCVRELAKFSILDVRCSVYLSGV